MILEQAFFHLPEILAGARYPRQRYEGGIVSAYCLALLQTLNGRNISNPISCLQAERPFRTRGWDRGDSGAIRYLRSDLHVRLDRLEVGSELLSAYGFRFSNWMEAKFFRKSTSSKQQNTGHLLEDLIRLLALVPKKVVSEEDQRDIAGRYLLHVYESFTPNKYLSAKRQVGEGTELRKWLTPLISGGPAKCERIRLAEYETDGILKQINEKLGDLEIEFEATTWRLGPTFDLGDHVRQYVCLLSRIDSFTVSRKKAELSVSADRSYLAKGAVQAEIRDHVGKWISIKADIEDEPPDPVELADGETDI